MKVVFVCLLLLYLTDKINSDNPKCENIENLIIEAGVRDPDSFTRIMESFYLSGEKYKLTCFTDIDIKFHSFKIDCNGSEVGPLKPKTFHNMENLDYIRMRFCGITELSPGTFYNVSALSYVYLDWNKLTHIPAGVFNHFDQLKIISLMANKISSIEDYAFANIPLLSSMALSKNSLDFITKNWFENSTKIFHFHAIRNAIQEIPVDMFEGWTVSGVNFNFDFNNISVIHKGAFGGVTSINNISLSHNRISDIHADAFSSNTTINLFRLNHNLIYFIPEKLLQKIKVNKMTMYGNPIKCPCFWKLLFRVDAFEEVETQYYEVNNCSAVIEDQIPICWVPCESPYSCKESVDERGLGLFNKYIQYFGFKDMNDFGHKCAIMHPHDSMDQGYELLQYIYQIYIAGIINC